MQSPERWKPGATRGRFTRGRARPRGVVWFGARSFWGHMRHFIASAIATEDVDSRDWMSADPPSVLVSRIAERLGGAPGQRSVTESVGRDVWIDYVADTGDDVSVSRAVAGIVFREYDLPDPAEDGALIHTPRGDILLFGGDTAYPVATADEITARVIEPFNQVLAERDDGRARVLLGIPGNHDWYDGLDGFGRLFRRHLVARVERPSGGRISRTLIDRYADFAREFVLGGQIDKPRTLDLTGYQPVQSASYFALPVAPGIGMLAVDRQLKNIDSRQQHFFVGWLNQNLAMSPWVVLPDPAYRFGGHSVTGSAMVESLGLSLTGRPHFVLSGDVHHYRREVEGPSQFVTAGGGGAFLHPAPLKRKGLRPAEVEFPDARQCRRLLWQVPWKVMFGRSGFLPHYAMLLLFVPAVRVGLRIYERTGVMVTAPIAITLVVTIVYALIGGIRRGQRITLLYALVAALLTAAVPIAFSWLLDHALHLLGLHAAPLLLAAISLAVGVLAGTFIFGAYLALLTALGLENTQAFTALDHPGFKHFVRLRVRADGSAVDGWVVGLVDPLGSDARPVLVDTFTWKAR